MKKAILIVINLISVISLNAQQINGITGTENWFNNWTDFKPKTTEYNESTHILTGIIDTNTTLHKYNTYLLINVVYIANNATLTIEPGTIIRGDFATCGTLVVTKGAKIIADGTVTDPIVFTSNKNVSERKPGDWGGIVILGDAPINKFGGAGALDFNLNPKYNTYGGQNPESDSGILKYVRIEFSGRKLNALKELNGLSLAGVGNKTKIEYVQISFSNDDSFESYGGNLKLNNLISFRATDDDFDFTLGSQCFINNSVAIRYPFSSDISRSRCFEIDSYDKIENYDLERKLTKITANNMTLINNEDNNQGLVKEAVYVKKDSFFELTNSVVSGFNQFILLDDKALLNTNLDKIKFQNLILNDCKAKVGLESNSIDKSLEEWIAKDSFKITTSYTDRKFLFVESDVKKNPDFRLKDGNSASAVLVVK